MSVPSGKRGIGHGWRDGYAISKAGIMLVDLVPAEAQRRTVFEGGAEKRDRLMRALDSVNSRFGRFAAVPAAQGFKRDWKMRADMESPDWTTRTEDVPRFWA